jgi:hypothetical protein
MKLKAGAFATDCPDRVLEPKRETTKNKSKTLCQHEYQSSIQFPHSYHTSTFLWPQSFWPRKFLQDKTKQGKISPRQDKTSPTDTALQLVSTVDKTFNQTKRQDSIDETIQHYTIRHSLMHMISAETMTQKGLFRDEKETSLPKINRYRLSQSCCSEKDQDPGLSLYIKWRCINVSDSCSPFWF